MTPFQPDTSPVGGSLFATAMVSCIPLLVVFVLLGFLKVKAHVAGLAGLASAILGRSSPSGCRSTCPCWLRRRA